MIGIHLLSNEEQDDSQILETDVMRFMAMIGIIFWMIFALAKSIPFEETRPSPVIPPVETFPVPEVLPAKAPGPLSQKAVKDLKKPPKPAPLPAKMKVKTALSPAGQPTLTINFRSMEDLEELIRNNRVAIYIRSNSKSFDLVFKSYLLGDKLAFGGGDSLPVVLWEIKGGTDFNHFKRLLEDTYPVARTSQTKNVYVHFIDKRLERKVESLLRDLRKQKRSGKIRIDRHEKIKFEELSSLAE